MGEVSSYGYMMVLDSIEVPNQGREDMGAVNVAPAKEPADVSQDTFVCQVS
jgi:hypothetical protein